MITIKHGMDVDGFHYVIIKPDTFGTYREDDYTIGWREPRYPMPARCNAPMCCALNYVEQLDEVYAFDGDWNVKGTWCE